MDSLFFKIGFLKESKEYAFFVESGSKKKISRSIIVEFSHSPISEPKLSTQQAKTRQEARERQSQIEAKRSEEGTHGKDFTLEEEEEIFSSFSLKEKVSETLLEFIASLSIEDKSDFISASELPLESADAIFLDIFKQGDELALDPYFEIDLPVREAEIALYECPSIGIAGPFDDFNLEKEFPAAVFLVEKRDILEVAFREIEIPYGEFVQEVEMVEPVMPLPEIFCSEKRIEFPLYQTPIFEMHSTKEIAETATEFPAVIFQIENSDMKTVDIGEIEGSQDVFMALSSVEFLDEVLPLDEIVCIEKAVEIAFYNTPEIEVENDAVIPNTDAEFAAAIFQVEASKTITVSMKEIDDSGASLLVFCNLEVIEQVLPLDELFIEEQQFEIASYDCPEVEIEDCQEPPNTEEEFYAAIFELKGCEIRTVAVEEISVSNSNFMVFSDIEIEDDFRTQFAVVAKEIRIKEEEIQIAIFQDPKIIPMQPNPIAISEEMPILERIEVEKKEKGFAALAGPALELESSSIHEEIAVVPEFSEPMRQIALPALQNPQNPEIEFGNVAFEESFEPMGEVKTAVASLAAEELKEAERKGVSFGDVAFEESFEPMGEIFGKVEQVIVIQQSEEGEEVRQVEGISFGDIAIKDKIEPFVLAFEDAKEKSLNKAQKRVLQKEIAADEKGVKENTNQTESSFVVSKMISDYETGVWRDVPDTSQEFTAALDEIRVEEEKVEFTLFEEPKLLLASAGNFKILEETTSYIETPLPKPKVELEVVQLIDAFEPSGSPEQAESMPEFMLVAEEVKKREKEIETILREDFAKAGENKEEAIANAKKAETQNDPDAEINPPAALAEQKSSNPEPEKAQTSLATQNIAQQEESKVKEWILKWLDRKPVEKEEEKRRVTFWPKRISARHVWGYQQQDCIPFATNFTSLDIFSATDYRPGTIYPFLDLRGHRFDNNTYGLNAGVGGRFVPNSNSGFCEMLGFNLYYDYRQGCIGYYNQIGVGVEVLGRRWDFRGNVYAPFGNRRHMNTCLFDDYEGDYYAIRRDIESVSYSFNGEVGYLFVNGKDFSLYGAAGPYFLARGKCCTSTAGIEGRIRPQYRDYIALDLSGRYDELFGAIWQMEFIFNLPLYKISKKNERPCGLRDWQIYQPIQRFEVMPLQKRSCWETNY